MKQIFSFISTNLPAGRQGIWVRCTYFAFKSFGTFNLIQLINDSIMKKFCFLSFFLFVYFFSSTAQNYTQDTQTIESTMEAVLDVISGPAGKKIDVVRWRNLFRGDVKFLIRSKNKEGQLIVRESSVEDYAKNIMLRIEAQDFFETVGNLTIDRYGDIAQVFMAYETRKTADGVPFDKGINSFQLLFDQNRWWVTSLMWQAESSGVSIPAQYAENIEKE